MLTMKNELKQGGILMANGTQSAIPSFSFYRSTDAVQQPIRRGGQSDDGKRRQIATVSGKAEFCATADIGNTSPQWQPFHNQLTSAQTFAPYAETPGVVNGCLNPQHAALLVVHFDRVL